MRRRGATVIIIAILAAAFFGTWTVAYRAGQSNGQTKVSTDRSSFQTRVASGPQAASTGGGGGGGGPAGTRGAGGGSAVAGGGPTSQAGGSAVASGNNGTPGAGRGATTVSTITGKVTKIDGTTLSVQQTDNSMINVATTADTAIRKLVAAALTDLKTGDLVTVDGSKTGDTAYSAKSVTSLGAAPGGGRGQGGPPAGASGAALTGQIKSLDGATIMVQGFDGTSVTVTTTPATVIRTQQPGALSDIKAGDVLLIQGDKTSDTAFLARSITNQGATSG